MPKIKSLNTEDLNRWRVASVDRELVELSFAGMSVGEARTALMTHYRVLNDILTDYELTDIDSDIFISPVDGGVYAVGAHFE